MARDRYAVLGLGRARSPWFSEVAGWATSGAIPADFTKALSPAEVRQRLAGLQPWSALIIDADFIRIDAGLIAAAVDRGVPVLVVSDNDETLFMELGASTTLPSRLHPSILLGALAAHAHVVAATSAGDLSAIVEEISSFSGQLIAVTGPGGTGASVIAMAFAQSYGTAAMDPGLTLLADFTRNSELAMLHDTTDVVPSLEDAVDLHRSRRPSVDEIRGLTFTIPARGYQLLLGARKSSAWTAMPERAVHASIDGLRRSFRTVVADITADFEGEDVTGSRDIEERNALARLTASRADIVAVVGLPGMKGVHAMARTIRDLLELGLDADRLLPIVNRAPKGPIARNEIAAALRSLVHVRSVLIDIPAPVFLPERNLESTLRDTGVLPKQLTKPLAEAVRSFARTSVGSTEQPQAIVPGSLGLGDYDEAVGQ